MWYPEPKPATLKVGISVQGPGFQAFSDRGVVCRNAWAPMSPWKSFLDHFGQSRPFKLSGVGMVTVESEHTEPTPNSEDRVCCISLADSYFGTNNFEDESHQLSLEHDRRTPLGPCTLFAKTFLEVAWKAGTLRLKISQQFP